MAYQGSRSRAEAKELGKKNGKWDEGKARKHERDFNRDLAAAPRPMRRSVEQEAAIAASYGLTVRTVISEEA